MAELESVVARPGREPNGGLIVMPDAFMLDQPRGGHIAGGSLPPPRRLSVPSFRELGGLLSYGKDGSTNIRRAASYADRILKGEKPGDLPVQCADQVRAGHQSQDRQGARPGRAADACSPAPTR